MEWIKHSLVYTADSIRNRIGRFEIESDGLFDSRFDSNAKKNDSQVPSGKRHYGSWSVSGRPVTPVGCDAVSMYLVEGF